MKRSTKLSKRGTQDPESNVSNSRAQERDVSGCLGSSWSRMQPEDTGCAWRPPGKGSSDKRGHLEKKKQKQNKINDWRILWRFWKKIKNNICIVIKHKQKIALQFSLENGLRELNPVYNRRKLISKVK